MSKGHHHFSQSIKDYVEDHVFAPLEEMSNTFWDELFVGIPEHYPFKKKFIIYRTNSQVFAYWDILQIVFVIITCALYAVTRYPLNYDSSYWVFMVEVFVTQFFMVDFLLNLYLQINLAAFLLDHITVIDMLTMLPVYLILGNAAAGSVNFLRCLRILRLMRMFRTVRAIKNLNPVKRQVVNLAVTLISMIYLAASIVQVVEDDVHQLVLDCRFINRDTNFRPSCSVDRLVTSSTPTGDCDCVDFNCEPYYLWSDHRDEPSGIRCDVLSFDQAVYFIIVTMATVGYGDISAQSDYGRFVVICFIIASLVVIPARISELQRLLSMRSPYSTPYAPAHSTDRHVIVCGHVNNKLKLERFFQEFFHEDHDGNDAHIVILSAKDPAEDVRALLANPMYDAKVTYILGSALNIDDLKKARCDIAESMFFLADMKADDASVSSEDAATVLRALSVSNFNQELKCLVQVLKPEERVILKDSDIGVILCLEEYKTALQARNAVCPGFSTIVENLFHSIESINEDELDMLDIGWYKEYLHGAGLELYLMPLPKPFLVQMRYNYHRIVEGIFLKYNVMVLGLTCDDHSSIIFNPSRRDIDVFKHMKGMFNKFNIALVMAEDQHIASEISRELSGVSGDDNRPIPGAAQEVADSILREIDVAESRFPCRRKPQKSRANSSTDILLSSPGPVLAASPAVQLKQMSALAENEEEDESSRSAHQSAAATPGTWSSRTMRFRGSTTNMLSSVVGGVGGLLKGVGSQSVHPVSPADSGSRHAGSSAPGIEVPAAEEDDVASDDLSSDANGYTDDSDVDDSSDVTSEASDRDVDAKSEDSDVMASRRRRRYIGFKKPTPKQRKLKPSNSSCMSPETLATKAVEESPQSESKNRNPRSPIGFKPGGGIESPVAFARRPLSAENARLVSPNSSQLLPDRSEASRPRSAGVHSMGAVSAVVKSPSGPTGNRTQPNRLPFTTPTPDRRVPAAQATPESGPLAERTMNATPSRVVLPPLSTVKLITPSGKGTKSMVVDGPALGQLKKSTKKRPISAKKYAGRIISPEAKGDDAPGPLKVGGSEFEALMAKEYEEFVKEDDSDDEDDLDDRFQKGGQAAGAVVAAPTKARTASSDSSMGRESAEDSDSDESKSSGDGEQQHEDTVDDEEENSDDESDSWDGSEADRPKRLQKLPWEKKFGKTSREIRNAFKITNHVILFGCEENLPMFISELRREAVTGDSYHPILIVAEHPPKKWEGIKNRYNDIYFLRGDISSLEVFTMVNIDAAYSFILMCVKGGGQRAAVSANAAAAGKTEIEPAAPAVGAVTSASGGGHGSNGEMDEESLDAVTLFTYLKLEQYIPQHVFCSVELNCTTNMAVMNATIMRRARERAANAFLFSSRGQAVSDSRRGSAIEGDAPAPAPPPPVLMSTKDSTSGGRRRQSAFCNLPGRGKGLALPQDGSKLEAVSVRRTDMPKKSLKKEMSGHLGASVAGGSPKLRPSIIGKSISAKNANMNTMIAAATAANKLGGAGSGVSVRKSSSLSNDADNSTSHDRRRSTNISGSSQDNSSSSMDVSKDGAFSMRSMYKFVMRNLYFTEVFAQDADTSGGGSGRAPLAIDGMASSQQLKENQLWDTLTTHHMLPVFAAAKAFVPTSFESLLVQSFYLSLTPVICEKLVCGQVDQIIMQIDLPKPFIKRRFVDLYRLFINHKVLCLGLYRAPDSADEGAGKSPNNKKNGSLLPYVYLSPHGDAMLNELDRVFIYGTSKDTQAALAFAVEKIAV